MTEIATEAVFAAYRETGTLTRAGERVGLSREGVRRRLLDAGLWTTRRTHRNNLPPQPCAGCGHLFGLREGEQPCNFRRRKTCSRACQGRLARRILGLVLRPRSCAACGQTFERRANEACREFRRRLTCSAACANVLRAAHGWRGAKREEAR